MPGFLGCVSTTAAGRGANIAQISAYEDRVFQEGARYAIHSRARFGWGIVAGLVPRLRKTMGGAYHEAGGSVLYVGRFEQAPFATRRDGSEIARALWSLYRDRGKRLAQDVAGSYLIFVLDRRRRSALLINDHYASYQCFVAQRPEGICFAPEVHMLVDACGLQPTMDLGSVASLLVNGQLLSGSTFFTEAKALEPGSVVEAGPDIGVSVARHYRFGFEEQGPERPLRHYVEGLSERLMAAMESRADVLGDAVIPLSGGYDSRGLAACAVRVAKKSGARIRTVTWGLPGGEEMPHTDAASARQIAAFLGTEHVYIPRTTDRWVENFEHMLTMTDGLTDDCAFHAGEHALFGRLHTELGADHAFSGNHMFGPAGEAATDLEAMARIGIFALGQFPSVCGLFDAERLAALCEVSEAYASRVMAGVAAKDPNNRKDFLHYAQRIQNYTNHSAHYKQCAIWVHNPWLDRSILDFMRTVPPPLRVKKELYKRTLRHLFPALENRTEPVTRYSDFNNIEDWDAVLRADPSVSAYVVRHLYDEENGLHALLDREKLRDYIDGFLGGRRANRPRSAVLIGRAKSFLSRYPALYRVLKRQAMPYFRIRELPPSLVLFRLLILKKVYDRYGQYAQAQQGKESAQDVNYSQYGKDEPYARYERYGS